MLLDDGVLGLCPFEADDSRVYRDWVNDEAMARLLGRATPVTQAGHEAWYQSVTSSPQSVVFAVRHLESGQYLGNVWLHGIHWVNRNAELRILLGAQQAREKGHGTRACQLLLRFAFEKLGLHKVYLYVSSGNPRARRAFEKAGFVEEGVLREEFFIDGRFLDVFRMAALAPPAGPV
jgi:RimJ/RimL family protein N-acetyltransferase